MARNFDLAKHIATAAEHETKGDQSEVEDHASEQPRMVESYKLRTVVDQREYVVTGERDGAVTLFYRHTPPPVFERPGQRSAFRATGAPHESRLSTSFSRSEPHGDGLRADGAGTAF